MNILGGATLTWPKPTNGVDVPEDLKKKMEDMLDSDEIMDFILGQRPPESMFADLKENVETMERIRKGFSGMKDNNLKRQRYFAENLVAVVAPKLAEVLYKAKLPPDFIIKRNSKMEDIERFLDNVPTARCWFTLLYQRDQQLQRPIQENDLNDIWFLTLAIPYSDIVITERMWASISRDAKLDTKYDTSIFSSIRDLDQYL